MMCAATVNWTLLTDIPSLVQYVMPNGTIGYILFLRQVRATDLLKPPRDFQGASQRACLAAGRATTRRPTSHSATNRMPARDDYEFHLPTLEVLVGGGSLEKGICY